MKQTFMLGSELIMIARWEIVKKTKLIQSLDRGLQILDMIRECIAERKGRDTVVLDLTKLTAIADYFVICSGTSSMHARAISEHIALTCKRAGLMPIGIEGEKNARWILLDYGDVVIHIFVDETRQFYNLERLWGDARRVEFESE